MRWPWGASRSMLSSVKPLLSSSETDVVTSPSLAVSSPEVESRPGPSASLPVRLGARSRGLSRPLSRLSLLRDSWSLLPRGKPRERPCLLASLPGLEEGLDSLLRSEERRVGKECLRLCRSRWSPYH